MKLKEEAVSSKTTRNIPIYQSSASKKSVIPENEDELSADR